MSVASPCVAWVGGLLEGPESFVDDGEGDFFDNRGGVDFGRCFAEGEEVGRVIWFKGGGVEFLGDFLKGGRKAGKTR